MTNDQLIEKFNPENAGHLSPEDIEIMRGLTNDQLDVLAAAYPNQPTRRSYIRLYDKNLAADKQLYQLSTWQNIRNVRKFSNRPNLIPWDFLTSATRFNQHRPPAQIGGAKVTSPKKIVVDLTAQEAADELRNISKPAGNTVQAVPVANVTTTAPVSPKKGKGKKTPAPIEAVDINASQADSKPDDQVFGDGQ